MRAVAELKRVLRAVWTIVRGAIPALVVATFIPLVLFYAAFEAGSVMWAIGISVAYAYGVAAYQYCRRRRVSGLLLVTVFVTTVRTLGALVSGHTFVYFAVPVLETAGFGLMFMATMFSSEPLIVRLARDLVPHAADHLAERRGLTRGLSLIWMGTYLMSGATTLGLLVSVPLSVYLGAHELTGWFWTGSGVALSVLVCRRWAKGLVSEIWSMAHLSAAG
ncbi:MAG: hypothetical protein ACRDWW_08655 [Acidimicrobiales bacterium]